MEWSGPEILEPTLEAQRWSSSATHGSRNLCAPSHQSLKGATWIASSSADVGLDSTGYKVKQADCHGSRNLCAPSHQSLKGATWIASSSDDVGLDSTGYKVKQADCHGSRNLCAPSHQSLKGATWIASLLFSLTTAGAVSMRGLGFTGLEFTQPASVIIPQTR
ncbi:hypothetical protein AXG93_3228s1300 [Marchantia polymorpha subsp. ruderalis]|uniref:Uncharacterized protein n=1 Tax=Marchantia polymorpha subsp. ruderalis TaxID=1480154 RepID=A0A176WIY2_MARPO|nr:hypothetical protein AXG93_3228s1300 [Marchantia polymorpha subsp. ruderalis]